MDDLEDPELEGLVRKLKHGLERRRSLVASPEDIAGTQESLDGEWGEWMCAACGIFMRESRLRCSRCQTDRY